MPYDIGDDPYTDPNTGVLRNKIGASTKKQLDQSESEITYIAITTLVQGVEGRYVKV